MSDVRESEVEESGVRADAAGGRGGALIGNTSTRKLSLTCNL